MRAAQRACSSVAFDRATSIGNEPPFVPRPRKLFLTDGERTPLHSPSVSHPGRMATRDRVLLTSDAARLLGVSASTVASWARRGRLRHRLTARGVRLFDARDVERLAALRAGTSDATQPEVAS